MPWGSTGVLAIFIITVTINLDSIQQDVLAVGSEHPSVLLYSTLSGDCLARLEGHTKRYRSVFLLKIIPCMREAGVEWLVCVCVRACVRVCVCVYGPNKISWLSKRWTRSTLSWTALTANETKGYLQLAIFEGDKKHCFLIALIVAF